MFRKMAIFEPVRDRPDELEGPSELEVKLREQGKQFRKNKKEGDEIIYDEGKPPQDV